MSRLVVVGAGIAGLAAALAAARAGRKVELYEATAQAGGRCRGLADGHDNGTHVLLGANRTALAFLDAIGARQRWVEPEPDGLPLLDLATGALHRVGISPWSWLRPERRPPGLGFRDLPGLLRLGLPGRDRPVAELAPPGPVTRCVIEPLTLAALNTPLDEASSARLGRVLRRVLLPGAGRLLVAREGLGPDLVAPALAALAQQGVTPRLQHRLKKVVREAGRAVRLVFNGSSLRLAPDDAVVLALPPYELARLLPDLPLPEAYEPIVNLHFAVPWSGPVRFVGVLGGLAQWVLWRPGTASVTISAGRTAAGMDAEALIATVWPEVAPVGRSLGMDGLPEAPPPCRVIKERRATLRQGVAAAALPDARPCANLTLAGDWLDVLPATIEAAVRSGLAAVGQKLRPAHARPDAEPLLRMPT